MSTRPDTDFQNVRDKVIQIDQRMEEIVLPALTDIKVTLSKMAFVTKEDYAKDEAKRELWKAEVIKFMQDAKPAIKFFNVLNSRWTQILIGGLIAAALIGIVSQIPSLGVKIGG